MLDQSMELVPVFVDGAAAAAQSPFSSKEFEPLGHFLVKHPDIKALTVGQAKEIKRLCRDLGVSFNSYATSHGVTASYLSCKFPALSSIALGHGGNGRLVLTPQIAQELRARVVPHRPIRAQEKPIKVALQAPSAPPAARPGTLTVNINGENISMSFPICGKPDVEKVSDLLSALMR